VIINESIELAKAYGGTDGHKYVNGVLDKLAASLRPAEVEAKRAARGKAVEQRRRLQAGTCIGGSTMPSEFELIRTLFLQTDAAGGARPR
jgi:hypothetical protein